jgi:hypothetical protein
MSSVWCHVKLRGDSEIAIFSDNYPRLITGLMGSLRAKGSFRHHLAPLLRAATAGASTGGKGGAALVAERLCHVARHSHASCSYGCGCRHHSHICSAAPTECCYEPGDDCWCAAHGRASCCIAAGQRRELRPIMAGAASGATPCQLRVQGGRVCREKRVVSNCGLSSWTLVPLLVVGLRPFVPLQLVTSLSI